MIETRKTKLGEDHPDTLTSTASLASTFWYQGRWEEAEKLQLQVMETRKTKLGEDHPSTLSSMANLAFTWKSSGRMVNAIDLLKDCLAKCHTRPQAYNLRREREGWQETRIPKLEREEEKGRKREEEKRKQNPSWFQSLFDASLPRSFLSIHHCMHSLQLEPHDVHMRCVTPSRPQVLDPITPR